MKMKPVQNIIRSRRLWYNFLYLGLLEFISLPVSYASYLDGFMFEKILINEKIGWITQVHTSYSESMELPSPRFEMFCTIDWPVIIAARVTNTSINLSFGFDYCNGFITKVNDTTIRQCIEQDDLLSRKKKHACFLTLTKATLRNEEGSLGLNWKQEFDSHFQKECAYKFLRGDSHFLDLPAHGSDLLSVCSEGLGRIKSNGFFQFLDVLTNKSAMSQDDYEVIAIRFGTIAVIPEDWDNSTSLTCDGYILENNSYAFSQEFLNFYFAEKFELTMTSPTIIIVTRFSDEVIHQWLNIWIFELVELSYRTAQDSPWHTLSNRTVQLVENEVIVWDNVIKAELDIIYFRIRIKSSFSPHCQIYLINYFKITQKINNSIPETRNFMFHIFHEPNKILRTVTIYWRPVQIFSPLAEVSYVTDVLYELDENYKKIYASNTIQHSLNHFQAEYTVGPAACKFYIKSVAEGTYFSDPIYIDVPSAKDVVKSNIFLYLRNYLNSTLEYNWQIPKNLPDIVYFTLVWYWADKNSTDTKLDNVKMDWIDFAPRITKVRMIFDTSSKLFRSFVSVITKYSTSGLLAPRQTIFSISNLRKSGERSQSYQEGIETSNRTDESQNTNFKQTVNIGRKFSATRYQKWLQKLLEDKF